MARYVYVIAFETDAPSSEEARDRITETLRALPVDPEEHTTWEPVGHPHRMDA